MYRWLLIITLLIAWGIGATLACAGNGNLSGFGGVFLRVFIGYALIIAISHFICLLLPKFGIGSDPRND